MGHFRELAAGLSGGGLFSIAWQAMIFRLQVGWLWCYAGPLFKGASLNS
jgi:hypothetical protein